MDIRWTCGTDAVAAGAALQGVARWLTEAEQGARRIEKFRIYLKVG